VYLGTIYIINKYTKLLGFFALFILYLLVGWSALCCKLLFSDCLNGVMTADARYLCGS